MCGICGIVYKDKHPVERSTLQQMSNIMKHRGPDDEGVYLDGSVGLGFRRLSIIDLTSDGSQPMTNEDGSLWLVFNGEIYNYRELRSQLKQEGHQFKSSADSEVVLHLYEEEGAECLEKLRGMFAFVIYDKQRQQLFGARDGFGIKPLYYIDNQDIFTFASEVKSLLQVPNVAREVNMDGFVHYLTYQYVPEPETIFRGIYKIPPAHGFTLKDGKMKLFRYWTLEFKPEDRPLEYFTEGILDKLRESVRLHRNCDVPWGAFLSGGVDSTTIVALLTEISGEVSTFSVGYEDEAYSELDEARETAACLGTDHHEYIITPKEYIRELPRLVWHFDEPVADPAAISLYFVARMASEHITVTLSGEGADEVFAGYGIYHEPFSLMPFQRLPWVIQQAILFASKLLPDGVRGKSFINRATTPVEERYFGNATIFDHKAKSGVLGTKPVNLDPTDITRPYFERVNGAHDVTKMQYIDFHTWLPGDILSKADKMTMANSLELRVPFLDHEVFEFAATIPTKYKIMGNIRKYALRKAVEDIVPPGVAFRQKRGFPVPTRVWLKSHFARFAREMIESAPAEFINRDCARNLLVDHLDGRADNSRKIWTILVFLIWYYQFIKDEALEAAL